MTRIKTSVNTIDKTISVCLKNNLVFAAYRLPNHKEKALIIQKEPEIHRVPNLSKITGLKGFLVAPFIQSDKNGMFIIKPDFYFKGNVTEEEYHRLNSIRHTEHDSRETTIPYEVSKHEYLDQIKSIADAIRENRIQKAVLSRIKVVGNNSGNRLSDIFSGLCEFFPNAFVYIFKGGGHFWMGASPEPFASLKNNLFQTSSVAGTKENTEKYQQLRNWGNKEKQEQQYVSDHILRVLKTATRENILQNGPYVKKAGNLLHLRTDFATNITTINGNIGDLLENLHPTPAVCGYQTGDALELISSTEKHDREYYCGFLGPIGMEIPINLFVNLRCMRISGPGLILYIGGGITIDSNPEDEWYETEIKAGTLLSVINNVP